MLNITFAPTKKQYEAIEILRDNSTRELLYWGGARGGKTYIGCAWIVMMCLEFPGTAWLIGRKELTTLKKTTITTLFRLFEDWGITPDMYNYNQQTNVLTFKGYKSTIFFYDLAYQPSDPLYTRLWGLEITWAFIDEANEVDYQCINVVRSRISHMLDKYERIPKILYTCNPSKNWVYQEFYKPYVDNTLREDRRFIPALVTDNPHISQEYVKSLESTDKITRERLLYGNFEYDDTPGRLYEYDDILALFTNHVEPTGERFITADIARQGDDKAVVMVWDGLKEIHREVYGKCSLQTLASNIRRCADTYGVSMSKTIVDEDGMGGGVMDMLGCKGFMNNSSPIQPRSVKWEPTHKVSYQNLKTQCYFELQKYIAKMSLIDEQHKKDIIEELDVVTQLDSEWVLKIVNKDTMKKKLGRSPDFADCIMFRMYFMLQPTKVYIASVL